MPAPRQYAVAKHPIGTSGSSENYVGCVEGQMTLVDELENTARVIERGREIDGITRVP